MTFVIFCRRPSQPPDRRRRAPRARVVYRDDYIAVVNKPSGLLSVPGNQPQYYDSAMSRVKEKYGFCEPAHRLDMATSGILLFALSKAADRELKRQFREREPKKYYQALVWGHVEQDHGVVELPLICDWENRPRQKICFEAHITWKNININVWDTPGSNCRCGRACRSSCTCRCRCCSDRYCTWTYSWCSYCT